MNLRVLCCGVALGLVASHAAAQCDNPPLVQVPTAGEAEDSEQDLEDLQARVQEYHAAMEAYTSCLQAEIDEARAESRSELIQTLLVARNNAAVAEVEAVVAQYNQLVQSGGGREE